ncbi:MAG: hypothetical protein WCW29_04330 [Candidatus Paceibacterota bacterium]|jgi:hypothetical protein
MVINTTKNSWAKKALEKAKGITSDILPWPEKVKSLILGKRGQFTLSQKIMSKNQLSESKVTQKGQKIAQDTINKYIKEGNMVAARNYAKNVKKLY